MKFAVVFAAVLAVSSAQFGQQYNAFGQQPQRFNRPTPAPVLRVPVPTVARPVAVTRLAPVVTRVSTNDQTANIVKYENDILPDGSYVYSYETDNGIAAQAQGTPRAFGGNPPLTPVVSQGSFSYTSPEGIPVVISYIADENGFQPQGDVLPTPPPTPDYILRSLEYNARNPQQ